MPSGTSIGNFRKDVEDWMTTHKNSAVLITLMAHSTPTTGEIVYSHPGAKVNKYTSVDKVRYLALPLVPPNICIGYSC